MSLLEIRKLVRCSVHTDVHLTSSLDGVIEQIV